MSRRQRERPEGTIRFRCNFRNTVYDVLKGRGWKETSSDTNWDIHWADRDWVYDVFDTMHLESWQRLNHYRNGRELCRKDLLVKNIKRKRRTLEKEGAFEEAQAYNFLPVSFVLPREYAMFVEEFKRQGGVWIMKPIGSAQGKGIFLFTRLAEISEWRTDFKQRADRRDRPEVEAYIVQRYIADPYLVGGKKFDLRLYALVTNFSPLTVWMHRSGFARFTNYRYNNDVSNIENMFVHLTNVAIQKKADDYDDRTGGKWELQRLKEYMVSRFGMPVVDALFWEIQMIVVRSLLSVQQVMINDKHCFELYGYDVMIDSSLKPWLIEVNASPSLSANTEEDYLLKYAMLSDAFDILDLEGRARGDEEHVGGFDLVYDDGYVDIDPGQCGYSTYLGAICHEPETFGAPPGKGGRGGGGGGGEGEGGGEEEGGNPVGGHFYLAGYGSRVQQPPPPTFLDPTKPPPIDAASAESNGSVEEERGSQV